jgi:hypothetical protein
MKRPTLKKKGYTFIWVEYPYSEIQSTRNKKDFQEKLKSELNKPAIFMKFSYR